MVKTYPDDFYVQVEATLKALLATNKSVIKMTPTIASPTTSKIVNDFIQVFPNIKHVVYDSIQSDAALNAYEKYYGIRFGRL